MQDGPIFRRLAIIGLGLIGSSVARSVRRHGLADRVVGYDQSEAVRREAAPLAIVNAVAETLPAAVDGADAVMLCTPLSAYASIATVIGPRLARGTVVTDVGSVKGCALRDVVPRLPAGVPFVAGHPIAGTEKQGPSAGFAGLFEGRWCILTPEPDTDRDALELVARLWRGMGSMVQEMPVEHHDMVLAITSHLPHLIAYCIVDTATDLADDIKAEVIKFSASGFRDFTRIAASDPVMWRDIFLNNREAVLQIMQRFNEDLTALQRAIRRGEADTLERVFTRTRDIRRGVVEARQA